jgi:acyl-CoA hydrolase
MSPSASDMTLPAGTERDILLPPRAQAESRTEMTEYVLPQHANVFGNVFGGQIMAWVDLCAAICAQRHAGKTCVTAFVDDLLFEKPVRVGELVRLRAQVTATFRTSMEIEVVVRGEDSTTRKEWPCVRALVTFVAIDARGVPSPSPPLALDGEEVRATQLAGEERRRQRLALRK